MRRGPLFVLGLALGSSLALFGGACKGEVARCEDDGGEWFEETCWPGLPTRDCPAGTYPRLGEAACVPVGHGSQGSLGCPVGFETAADGWGCAPVRASACQPGFRPLLGQTGCERIDDCQRAFPPAEATIFVDDDYGAAELDATHFASLTAAVAAAPAGAHLAIERGVYEGVIVLERPMTLEGRCVAGTLLGDLMAGRSVVVEAGVAAGLSHVSFGNYTGGIQVRAGGTLDASHLYLELVGSLGLSATGEGALIRAREVVIRDMLAQSGTQADGIPVIAREGGVVSLSESFLSGYYQGAGVALGAGSRVTFERVIAERGRAGAANSAFGMIAESGARLDVRASVFHHSGGSGFNLAGAGTLLIAEDVVVLDAATTASGGAAGRALGVMEGAEAQISGFTFRSGGDTAILVSAGQAFLDHGVVKGVTGADGLADLNTGAAVIETGELALTSVALRDTAGNALVAVGGTGGRPLLVAREVLVDGAYLDTREDHGVGLSVVDNAIARIEHLTIREASWVGVQVAGPGSSLEAVGLAVIGTRSVSSEQRGLGIVVSDGASLLLRDSRLRDTDGIGLTVGDDSVAGATGESVGVSSTMIEGNGLGVNTQGSITLELTETLPTTLRADRLLLSEDTRFRDNGVRIASERVALPPPPPPFSP